MTQGSVLIAALGVMLLMSWVIGRAQKRRLERDMQQIEEVTEIR